MSISGPASAWVESPLQLLCVVEWAFARGQAVRIVPRSGAAQLPATAARLREIGLPDGVVIDSARPVPVFSSDHWIIGDAFSGMVRSALALRMPQLLTVVDDGAETLRLPDVLSGSAPLSRSTDAAPARAIAELASSRLRHLDQTGALELFSYYALDLPSRTPNRFRWLRSRGLTATVPSRVLLGSASVVDGLMPEDVYLSQIAAVGPASYFPHRRETLPTLQRIAALPGVVVEDRGLPIELVLAGAREVVVTSLPSSAVETLRIILLGSGSTVEVLPALVAA
jgi:hypothetical protein